MAAMEGIQKEENTGPNCSLYVHNLNERLKKDELRKNLYALFSAFGTVLDVVALKTQRMRGQAFVVFKDVASATSAMRNLQDFSFFDKQMKIEYAKGKSDAIAKLDGSFVPRNKRREPKKSAPPAKKQKTETGAVPVGGSQQQQQPTQTQPSKEKSLQPKVMPANKILFIENLPEGCTDLMIQMLFQQFPGFKEVRMVAGKNVIAFVEFDDELQAGVAMNALQHFKITPNNLMVISYARK